MATHKMTPMALGERRVIDGVEHVCVAIPRRFASRLPMGCTGCPHSHPDTGDSCASLWHEPSLPLCGYNVHVGFRRVYPLPLIATLVLQGIEFYTTVDPLD